MDPLLKEKLEKSRKSFWGFFIARRPVTWVITLAIIIFGVISALNLPQEIQPEIKIPFAVSSAILPGASPQDTETLLVKPMEKEIATLDDIKTMSSNSGFGVGSVFVEFDASVDMDLKLQEMKEAVDRAKIEFPDDAFEPVTQKAEANAISIVTFSLTGTRPLYQLTEIAETVKDELESLPGVSDVPILGGQSKYIEVLLDQKKMEGYGLNILQIANQIELENSNIPVGTISSDKLNYSVRIDNRLENIEDIQNLPIFSTPDATPILLKDLGTVKENFPEINVISKVSENGQNSLPAVSLQIFKKEGGNINTIVKTAQDKMQELKENGTIPDDVNIDTTNDNSIYIKEELGNLTGNGLQTVIIIIVILFLALGLSQGIIAGLSIPLIFLIALAVLDLQGLTLNTLSLFSLVISLGLIVDTAIVIMEGIHENIKNGLTPEEAALLSVETYKWPLIAGTMTTIFAFAPMLLVSGILGEFLKTLPITISAALFSSLFVALVIIPAVSTKFVKKAAQDKKSILEPMFEKIGEKFHDFIAGVLKRRVFRYLIILGTFLAFALSMVLPISGALPVEMFPKTDQHYFIVRIETPKGMVVSETKNIAEDVEKYILTIPEVKNFQTNIGTTQSVGLSSEDGFVSSGALTNSNLANITVNLVDKTERERKSYEVAAEVRSHFENYQKSKIVVEDLQEGPPSDAAVTVRITGQDMETLKSLAAQFETLVASVPGTQNIETSLKPGLNEFEFSLDRDKLTYHGLSSIQVSGLIRSIIQGLETTTITIDGEDYDVITKYNLATVDGKTNFSVDDIENLEIATPKGYSVSLSEISNKNFDKSLSSIEREDQKRIIKVTADTDPEVSAVVVNQQIEDEIAKMDIPSGYEVALGGDLEQINQSFQELFRSMLVAVILIAFTLVLMFNSFRQPIIIMLTLPMAMIGVFPGLALIGLNISFPAFLGIVALSGVVVNDAIVLIDRINNNRKNGVEFNQSISEAANARLQPIFMTTITTIAGILPLAISNEFWAGLGFSLIFGLAASTILTLVVIPIIYYGLESGKEKKRLKNLQAE